MVVLWSTFGDCPNYGVLKGHGAAVLDVNWSWDGTMVLSASVDKYGAAWDAETGQRVKKLRGHSSFVNSIVRTSHGAHVVVTGSDDGNIIVRWLPLLLGWLTAERNKRCTISEQSDTSVRSRTNGQSPRLRTTAATTRSSPVASTTRSQY